MTKVIYFDMDGTVADLYGSKDWLRNLEEENAGTFINLEPLVNMVELANVCEQLMMQGWQFGVITWLPMQASREYEEVCTIEKKAWQEKQMPWVTEFYAQSYGVPKQYAPVKRAGRMVLVDDNDEVRRVWDTAIQRTSIDAKDNIIEELKKLLDK